MPLILFFYSILYRPFLGLAYVLRGINSKIKKGFELRKKKHGIKPWLDTRKNTKPIWFHCASGEYEYAKPVIRDLKQKHPQQKILVTYFSPSVESALSKATDVDFYCPLPWDTASEWKEFLSFHNPKALLIARTDLWPNMLGVCKKRNLPVLLFSKTVNSQKGFLKNFFAAPLLRLCSDIFCVSEEDRNLLYQQIRPYQNIHASGDTRFDQCLYRIDHGHSLKPLKNFNRPVFIGGSTWEKDEEVLLPLIKENIRDVSFILAPHEPSSEHLVKLTKSLEKLGIRFQKYSEIQSWDPQAVLLIDQVGILADLYAWSDYCFVGGSMNRSVHSVMEPLAQGNLVFVGPKHSNNREALTFKRLDVRGSFAVQSIRNSKELLSKFQHIRQTWSSDHQLDLKLAVKQKSGASELVTKWVENNTAT